MNGKTSYKEQLKIVIVFAVAFLILVLVIAGSDVYIHKWSLPDWATITLNIVSIVLAISAGGSFVANFLGSSNNKKKNK